MTLPTLWARASLFVSLSRLPHVALDLATPAFAALLWVGRFPPLPVVLLGLLTTFAGYTAVYALNDLVDRANDRAKRATAKSSGAPYLDAVAGRHPVAEGRLSVRAGWIWIAVWGCVAAVGAYLLNPVCLFIFIAGCGLEAVYCVMYRLSPYRALLSGLIKTLGAIAAVFAVDARPSTLRILLLVGMIFLWEIGGQNIPADWTDIEEDRRMNARTLPLRLGARSSTIAVAACLIASIALGVAVLLFLAGGNEALFVALLLVAGAALLVYPAIELIRTQKSTSATRLFNLASFYPLAVLVIVTAKVIAAPAT